MKIRIIAIGKPKESAINSLVDEYQKRLSRFARVELVLVPENKNTESKIIASSSDSFKILLDEDGKEYSTRSFAKYLEKKFQDGKNICFLVGGPDGHTDTIRDIADHTMSLSQLTFTHELALLFFHETLYRSLSVINNHPYHRD
jgi:23S rRNA (pseudouridine1915-N3)-methyltransferase